MANFDRTLNGLGQTFDATHIEFGDGVTVNSFLKTDANLEIVSQLKIQNADFNDSAIDISKINTLQSSLDSKAPIASPTFTGTVAGITKAMVGLDNVDNTADADKQISTAANNALSLKAPISSPSFTGTVAGITKTMVGLSNVDNTADADKQISTLTNTAITGLINSFFYALNFKANVSSPTFTGTVSGITQSMVGLSNVDNTTDLAKPISTATSNALNLKANLASPTFTGTVSGTSASFTGNVSVGGNFSVPGAVTGDLLFTGEHERYCTETLANGSTAINIRPICNVQCMLFNHSANDASGIYLTWNVNYDAQGNNSTKQTVFPYQMKVYAITLNPDNDGNSADYKFQFRKRPPNTSTSYYANTGTQATISVTTASSTSFMFIWSTEADRPVFNFEYQIQCLHTISNSSSTNLREFNLTLHGYQF